MGLPGIIEPPKCHRCGGKRIGVQKNYYDDPKDGQYYITECVECGNDNQGLDWPSVDALKELGIKELKLVDQTIIEI